MFLGNKHQGVVYTEEDLAQLVRLLHDARARWEDIATQLGLSQGDVYAIARKYSSTSDCLRESLILWLRGVDPAPIREDLARALQSPLVGREDIAQQVLTDIAQQIVPGPSQEHSKFLCSCFSFLCIVRPYACSLLPHTK